MLAPPEVLTGDAERLLAAMALLTGLAEREGVAKTPSFWAGSATGGKSKRTSLVRGDGRGYGDPEATSGRLAPGFFTMNISASDRREKPSHRGEYVLLLGGVTYRSMLPLRHVR